MTDVSVRGPSVCLSVTLMHPDIAIEQIDVPFGSGFK